MKDNPETEKEPNLEKSRTDFQEKTANGMYYYSFIVFYLFYSIGIIFSLFFGWPVGLIFFISPGLFHFYRNPCDDKTAFIISALIGFAYFPILWIFLDVLSIGLYYTMLISLPMIFFVPPNSSDILIFFFGTINSGVFITILNFISYYIASHIRKSRTTKTWLNDKSK